MDTEEIINSLKSYPTKYKQGLTEIELNEFLKEHKLAKNILRFRAWRRWRFSPQMLMRRTNV